MINKKLIVLTAMVATGCLQSMEAPAPAPLPPLRTRLELLKKHERDWTAPTPPADPAEFKEIYGKRHEKELQAIARFDIVLYLTLSPDSVLSIFKQNGTAVIASVESDLRYSSATLVTEGLLTQDEVPEALARIEKLRRRIAGTATFDEADAAECKVQ